MSLSKKIIDIALSTGFDFAGITSPSPHPLSANYDNWIEREFAGEMNWMKRNIPARKSPTTLWPECKTILVTGLNYRQSLSPGKKHNDHSHGLIAEYAWGLDYHHIITRMLNNLVEKLEKILFEDTEFRVYVDTGPVMEKLAANSANLGFIGKNSLLVNPHYGTKFFLGEILIDKTVTPGESKEISEDCGECSLCCKKCPTGALKNPYILDASRCISYLTIEHKGAIPHELRPLIGNWIFGCDLCQDVCPYNKGDKPLTLNDNIFQYDVNRINPGLLDLMTIDDRDFIKLFEGSVIARLKRRGLLRNVAVALGNWGSDKALHVLKNVLLDNEPLIRGHAAWATGKIGSSQAKSILSEARSRESDEYVLSELDFALIEF